MKNKPNDTPISGSAENQLRLDLIYKWKCLICRGETGEAALIKKQLERDKPAQLQSEPVVDVVEAEDVPPQKKVKEKVVEKTKKRGRGRPKKNH